MYALVLGFIGGLLPSLRAATPADHDGPARAVRRQSCMPELPDVTVYLESLRDGSSGSDWSGSC